MMTRQQLTALRKALPHGGQTRALKLLRKKGRRYHKASISLVLAGKWENPDIIAALIEVRDEHRAKQSAIARSL